MSLLLLIRCRKWCLISCVVVVVAALLSPLRFFTSRVKSKVALLITFSSNVRFEQYMHFVRNCPSANSFQGLPVPAAVVMIEEKTRLFI